MINMENNINIRFIKLAAIVLFDEP